MWKKLNFFGKITVSLLLSIVTVIILGQLIDLNVDFQTVLCFILAVVYSVVFEIMTGKKEKAIQNAMKDAAEWLGDGVLRVKTRTPKFKKALKCETDKISTMEHEDARYIYSSATVGGITTGGVTKIGDRDYIQTTNTGKYCLMYRDTNLVKKIQLSTELFEQAKKSPLSQYLEFDTKSIVVINKVEPSKDIETLIKFNPMAAIRKMQQDQKSGYPTKKKCMDIIKWLSTIR